MLELESLPYAVTFYLEAKGRRGDANLSGTGVGATGVFLELESEQEPGHFAGTRVGARAAQNSANFAPLPITVGLSSAVLKLCLTDLKYTQV